MCNTAAAGHISKGNWDNPLALKSSVTQWHAPHTCCLPGSGKRLGHTSNKKNAWSHQPPHSTRPHYSEGSTTPSNSGTAARPDCATLSPASLPLVSTLHTQKFQGYALLCWLFCQLLSTSQPSSLILAKTSGPRFHLCAPGLSSRQIQYQRIKRADPEGS